MATDQADFCWKGPMREITMTMYSVLHTARISKSLHLQKFYEILLVYDIGYGNEYVGGRRKSINRLLPIQKHSGNKKTLLKEYVKHFSLLHIHTSISTKSTDRPEIHFK